MASVRGAEFVYWIFALVGTCFFLFRLVGMAWGGFGEGHDPLGHGDVSGGGAEGAQGGGGTEHSHASDSTDAAFKLVSLQSLTGFFMTFGWAGLAGQKQFGLGTTLSFVIASVAGGLAMFTTAYLFKLMGKLSSAGDVFSVQKTLGLSGSVYAQIPAEGRGQIRLSVNNATRFIDAISEDRTNLESFVDVTVVRVVDGTTVAVRKSN